MIGYVSRRSKLAGKLDIAIVCMNKSHICDWLLISRYSQVAMTFGLTQNKSLTGIAANIQ